jgi:hypothetical protein
MRNICIVFCLLLTGCFDSKSNENWSFDTSKDKITDKETFLAIARSKTGHGGFVITCDAKARGFLKPKVLADRRLTDGLNPHMFLVRIDSEAAIFSKWEVSGDVATLNPVDEGIEHLASYIGTGSALVVRMQTIDGRDFDMEFDVRGMQKAIDWMSTKCQG